jgi:hypothetical protein
MRAVGKSGDEKYPFLSTTSTLYGNYSKKDHLIYKSLI